MKKLFLLIPLLFVAAACNLLETNPTGPSSLTSINNGLRYYGYWFYNYGDINYLSEIIPFSNIIHVRVDTDNGYPVWDSAFAGMIRGSGLKVMLQLPFNAREEWLTDPIERKNFLQNIKRQLANTGFISSIKYLEISEEWYTAQIPFGFLNNWSNLQDKSEFEKYEEVKGYLEAAIES